MDVTYDGHCFGCGQDNHEGLRLRFEPGPDGSVAEFAVPDRYQSWHGITHGGIVSLMLDEAVGWAAWHAGHPGVTGRLDVRLRRPLKLGERIRIIGRVKKVRRSLIYTEAVIESLADGGRIADASATLMAVEARIDSSSG